MAYGIMIPSIAFAFSMVRDEVHFRCSPLSANILVVLGPDLIELPLIELSNSFYLNPLCALVCNKLL